MNAEKTLVQLLDDLVAFRSESGEYQASLGCLSYAGAYLEQHGMHVQRQEFNNFPALVATTRKTKSPKVMLQAHIDVVSAPEACYKLRRKGDKLYGRGVFDMKFAAAAFLKAVDELQADLEAYDFGIMLTSDEEVGGENGVKALLDTGYGAEVCVLPDAGDDWQIETSHKGCWTVRALTAGRAAHGSRPWEGDNAIDRLVDALCDIREIFAGQHVDSDTLSINKITGGAVVNQVADTAEATLDIRFLDNQSYAGLRKSIEAVAAHYKVTLETVHHIGITETDTAHPLVRPFLRAVEQVRGRPAGRIRSLGTSDAHYFADAGIPVILMRPAGGDPHADNEWLDRDGFEDYCRVILAYLESVAATGSASR